MARGIIYKISGTCIAGLVCLIGINGILGQATNRAEIGLIGHMEISEQFLVSNHYHPNPRDPARLGAVHLEISSITGEKSINRVLISVDHGNDWTECSKVIEHLWTCEFFADEGALIRDFQELVIAVN